MLLTASFGSFWEMLVVMGLAMPFLALMDFSYLKVYKTAAYVTLFFRYSSKAYSQHPAAESFFF